MSALGPARRGKNGDHFLETDLATWFLLAAELTITEAGDESSGYWEEEERQDGPMSAFHAGMTLGGARDLHCLVPGHGRPSIANTPGTFYLGNLTGTRCQLIHQPCEEHDLVYIPGIGYRTVPIMMRTVLFPHFMSRLQDRLPVPEVLLWTLSNSFAQSMQLRGLRLPTLEECMMEESGVEEERRAEVVLRLATLEPPSNQVAFGVVKKPALRLRP